MKYSFKYKLFGNKVQMFSERRMGVVVEKEPHVVCVYGTDSQHQKILCAIPLCPPKFLKGQEYVIEFCENDLARISVSDIRIVINFKEHTCKINKNAKCYGSEHWGLNVQAEWSEP